MDFFIKKPKIASLVLGCLFMLSSFCLQANPNYSAAIDLEKVRLVVNDAAAWQIENIPTRGRVPAWNPQYTGWADGTFLGALALWSEYDNSRNFVEWYETLAEELRWEVGHRSFNPANDIAVALMYAKIWERNPLPRYLDPDIAKDRAEFLKLLAGGWNPLIPTIERLDYQMKTYPDAALLEQHPHAISETWSWPDALYMAAPVYAIFANITGDDAYRDFMDRGFWATVELLYDTVEKLFHQEPGTKNKREPNGEKMFWGRGNGWVAGALPLVIDLLPANYPSLPRYHALFKEFMERVRGLQQESGYWHSSMLDPASFPDPEASATGFFAYGLWWGINNGLLPKEDYLQPAVKAWQALVRAVHPNGMLGHVQAIGGRPALEVPADSYEVYGTGAFMLTGLEICKFLEAGGSIADGLVSPDVVFEKGWLSETVQAFLDAQNGFADFRKTGFSKTDYLDIIEGQVRVFMTHQDAEGRIIDPVKLEEKHYVTSLYAHNVAVLAASGHATDPDLIESGMLAMDVVTKDMSENRSAWALEEHSIGTGDFYTWPTMFAYDLFEGIASPERHALWRANIARMQPSEFYHAYHAYATNWNVVNLAGEFYRYLRGFTTIDYVESCLQGQLYHFTDYGMYDENGNPLAYDLFSRHYISGMLAKGYDGAHRKTYAGLSEKGAWMSLFMQSPFGELPTGFRSSHHIWNEALQCMVFEIYAAAYAQAGNHQKAGAFKRGAYLSLASIKEWIRPDGSGYVVKNKYPIEVEHGYEGYSNHSDYNLLASSILAQAWQFADDAIEEMAAPADIGGYVINIHDPFHKVIAAAGRSYVQYDTRGDQLYNPTGILRVHIYGSHPQLGPSDGVARRFGGEGVSIATGPLWKSRDGDWRSLAAHRGEDPEIAILAETPGLTSFVVTHRIADGLDTLLVSETISVTQGRVMIDTELDGNIDGLRITWPMLVFNGSEHTRVDIYDDSITLELEGRQIRFEVIDSEGHSLKRSGEQYAHRNGMVEPLVVETIGSRVVYAIGLP